jgi:hypothetical protein
VIAWATVLIPKNPRGRAVTKLCLTLESFRRTDEGRVRDATAFLGHYFPQNKEGASDRLFVHMPKEVRADLLSNWGVRGKKSALLDNDEKVRLTIADSLAAGDIDAAIIETGVTPEIVVDWVPLDDWWSFWRGSALPLGAVRKALAVARDLALFDERWFLDHLKLGTQKLAGTDVICAALSKDQIVTWLQAVHASGDASPAGLVAALGWEMILAKTAHEALLFALDGLATEVGLARQLEPKAEAAPAPAPAPAKAVATKASEPPPARPRASEPPLARPRASEPPRPRTSEAPRPVPAAPVVAAPPPPAPVAVTAPMPVVAAPALAPSSPASAAGKPPPPLPAAAAKASTPPGTAPVRTASRQMPAVVVTEPPTATTPPAPVSAPPSARQLFGAPAAPANPPAAAPAEPPPVRPPQRTLVGVGASPLFGAPLPGEEEDDLMAAFDVDETPPPSDDGGWIPPRAEPGDMGWDLVHGVKRPMPNNVQPKYNFNEKDDEPTSEIDLPGSHRPG